MKSTHEHVGYMVPAHDGRGHAVVGRCCGNDSDGVRIFHVNIFPYAQDCARCGRRLVEPRTAGWPQLFDGKLEPRCA